MSGIQLVGNTNNTTAAEVEVNTKAVRSVIRPDDYGSLGIYRLGQNNGTTAMIAGLAANSPIFAFRYGGANFAIVKRVLFMMNAGTTGFTAGQGIFNMFRCTSYTVADTGGTDIHIAANSNKLRTTGMANSAVSGVRDIAISATATLTAGTRTKDPQQLTSIQVPIAATTWTSYVPVNTVMFDQRVGEHPLVLATSEGFVIEATVPATGVWFFGVSVDWEELTSY